MMRTSEAINELATALAKAQGKIQPPPKDREVEVFSKRTNSKYKFRYTTLDCLIEAVREPLTENGLWFTQTLANGDGKYRLETTLMHSSGQWIASETPILTDASDNQAFGSALTYMKRYSLAAILGVASDEDDDANAADGNEVQSRKDRAHAPKAKAKEAAGNAKENAARSFTQQVIDEIAATKNGAELMALWDKTHREKIARIKEGYPDLYAMAEVAYTEQMAAHNDNEQNVMAAG